MRVANGGGSVIDGTPMPPVIINMTKMVLEFPSGQVAPFVKIAIPHNTREARSRRAMQLWKDTREKNFPMPVDCGLAERNSAYLYRTTSLSLSQCERLGILFSAYLVEVLI